MRARGGRIELIGRGGRRIDVGGRPLIGDLLPDGAGHRLEGQAVDIRLLLLMAQGKRHHQNDNRRRAEDAPDDEQVAPIAGALARRRVLSLLLAHRLQFPLCSRHRVLHSLNSLEREGCLVGCDRHGRLVGSSGDLRVAAVS